MRPNVSPNPYAASSHVGLDTHTSRGELASRSSRLYAALLDGLIPGVVAVVAGVLAASFKGGGIGPELFMVLLGLSLIGWIVYNLILIARYGQTYGKKLMKIRVVRSDGSDCGLGRYIGLRVLPIAILNAITGISGFIDTLLIFRESRQCLHDNIADTIVVNC